MCKYCNIKKILPENIELKETKNFKYELFIQPEINFATHQLLNLYFVTPEDPNYLEKRKRFAQVKQIKEYILGFGLCVRKPISKKASVYGLLSIGPAIVNKETESNEDTEPRHCRNILLAVVFSTTIIIKNHFP